MAELHAVSIINELHAFSQGIIYDKATKMDRNCPSDISETNMVKISTLKASLGNAANDIQFQCCLLRKKIKLVVLCELMAWHLI